MTFVVTNNKIRLSPWWGSLLLFSTAGNAQAENFMETDGLFEALTGTDVNQTQFMQSLGLNIGGWLQGVAIPSIPMTPGIVLTVR